MSENKTSAVVELETPIVDGDKTITSVTVRKPMPGELRGLKLPLLLNGDVDSFIVLIPRITSPIIAESDLNTGKLDVADMTEIMNEVMNFLTPRSLKAALLKLQTT